MRKKLTANTAVFAKALRNFLRGAARTHNRRSVASDFLRIPVRAVAHTCLHPPCASIRPVGRCNLPLGDDVSCRPGLDVGEAGRCDYGGKESVGCPTKLAAPGSCRREAFPTKANLPRISCARRLCCLQAMSANVRRANIDIKRARIDKTMGTLVDITGACERIFKSPVPLIYTTHSRVSSQLPHSDAVCTVGVGGLLLEPLDHHSRDVRGT